MIQAKDLMIGDWVEFSSINGYGAGQIAAIEPREGSADPSTFTIFKHKNDGSHFFIGVSKNSVRPIPLTPEILEKNFPDTETLVWWPSEVTINDEHILFHIETAGQVVGVSGEFRYVHRLQQALRLCGIEHEIKL